MTSHLARLYALVATVAVFFVSWAVIAGRPWAAEPVTAQDPRLAKLAAREQQLRREAARVQRVLDERWATYRQELEQRRGEQAAAPSSSPAQARVVPLPPAQAPLTTTRTS